MTAFSNRAFLEVRWVDLKIDNVSSSAVPYVRDAWHLYILCMVYRGVTRCFGAFPSPIAQNLAHPCLYSDPQGPRRALWHPNFVLNVTFEFECIPRNNRAQRWIYRFNNPRPTGGGVLILAPLLSPKPQGQSSKFKQSLIAVPKLSCET